MADAETFTHYVFVDFENVPSVDLGVIGGKPVHVTLLVGKQQKHLDVTLVRQALRHADQIELIEVGVAGRNALDLVLAAYLGRASLRHPEAEFTVVSKDRDFDPLLTHLQANGVRVRRNPDFFIQAVQREPHPERRQERPTVLSSRPRASRRRAETAPVGERPAAPAPSDRLEKIVARLTTGTGPLPRTEARFLHHLSAFFGDKLSEPELGQVFKELVRRGLVRIGENGRLAYPHRR